MFIVELKNVVIYIWYCPYKNEFVEKNKALNQTYFHALFSTSSSTGKEIIDVQQKLDGIQNRYDNIEHKSEDRLHALQQAIPLAADFDRLQKEFSNWLNQAERELRNFDPTSSTDKQKGIQEVRSILNSAIIYDCSTRSPSDMMPCSDCSMVTS